MLTVWLIEMTTHNKSQNKLVTNRTLSSSSTSSSSGQNMARTEKRDARMDDISSYREEAIQQRKREADEQKARKLQMYDNMAKSGNAGDNRPLDINTYRGKTSGTLLLSGAAVQKTDLVEETIRERVKRSEDAKKRLLAAYDYAAKTQPAGTIRDVDFESFKNVDGKICQ